MHYSVKMTLSIRTLKYPDKGIDIYAQSRRKSRPRLNEQTQCDFLTKMLYQDIYVCPSAAVFPKRHGVESI